MANPELSRSNTRRDARYQLARRIGLGTPWPLNTLLVTTQHRSGDPQDINTLERIHSKVSFQQREYIYVHEPQAGVRYWLVDEEALDLDPDKFLTSVEAAMAALKNQPERQAQVPDYRSSRVQPPLQFTTPEIAIRDENYAVIAQEVSRGLISLLQTRITVKAGVDIGLNLLARPHGTPEHGWQEHPRVVLDYGQTFEVRVVSGQANCSYQLADLAPGTDLAPEASPDGFALLSPPDLIADEVRDAFLRSQSFYENLDLQVFSQFVNTENRGYLTETIPVGVRPNTGLAVTGELSDTQAKAGQEPPVENPQNHPYTAYYQGQGGVVVAATQASVDYQVRLVSIDIPALEAVNDPENSDQDPPKADDLWSLRVAGGADPLTLPFTEPLEEDVVLEAEAFNRAHDWVNSVRLVQRVHFRIYPDPSPKVEGPASPLAVGQSATITLSGTQEGVSYQLHRTDTDEPLGEPQFHSKNKTISHAVLGIDFSPNSFAGDVTLLMPGLTTTTELYIKATKPRSGLTIRLRQTITLTVQA
ncbi:MAG: hypothetical protein AAFQ98_01315 [Bacteroidota bacterium]